MVRDWARIWGKRDPLYAWVHHVRRRRAGSHKARRLRHGVVPIFNA